MQVPEIFFEILIFVTKHGVGKNSGHRSMGVNLILDPDIQSRLSTNSIAYVLSLWFSNTTKGVFSSKNFFYSTNHIEFLNTYIKY